MSGSLLFGPFDDIMQSAFFLPWAILKDNIQAAVRAREDYLALSEAVSHFSASADAAAKFQVEPDNVQVDFQEVSTRLDTLLESVPTTIGR
mmetsp:Transcript_16229/g.45233  ORF Transcript_16229/g.45233 Transcript_16229/m.45233 type:complete len:91 (+) Transcript_16229:597-869(+)